MDRDVPLKARAAHAWCKAASKGKVKWRYLYVPEDVFGAFGEESVEMLVRVCEPALKDLIEEDVVPQMTLSFGEAEAGERLGEYISKEAFAALPKGHQKMVQQAVELFVYSARKPGQSLAPAFTPLLGPIDDVARALMLKVLEPVMPVDRAAQQLFFEPDLSKLSKKDAEMYKRRGSDLKRTLVDHAGLSPIGLLRWVLQQPREKKPDVGGIFATIFERFGFADKDTYKLVCTVNAFRNDYIAHQVKGELTDPAQAKEALGQWIKCLTILWAMHQDPR